jgi:GNAT superfamily N-acetyltransferase
MEPFTIEETPCTTELTEKADTGLSQHGLEATGFNEPIVRTAFVAKDGKTFAGCVTANIIWKTLHIRFMFVEAPYRGQKLGTALLEKALEYGRANGCAVAFVDTLSFQARGFYQKLGFELEFTRTGLAHDVSLYYLKKDLRLNTL